MVEVNCEDTHVIAQYPPRSDPDINYHLTLLGRQHLIYQLLSEHLLQLLEMEDTTTKRCKPR